jgi:hypothetical protein
MSTQKEKIISVARRVLKERGPLPAASIAEVVNRETRDGVHPAKLTSMFVQVKDIVKVPKTRSPILYMLNQNVDAGDTPRRD